MKSKLRGVSRKLIYGDFHLYYKEKGLSTLIGVDVKNSFSSVMMDLSKVSYAAYLIELVDQIVKQNDDPKVYELLKDTLLKIESGLDPEVLTNIIQLKLLDFLGVTPNIDSCSICGNTKGIVTVDADKGGYICRSCYDNEPLFTEKTIGLIRMFYYVDIAKITKLDIESKDLKEIEQFLDDYYDRYTGIYLKSKTFLKKINSL